MHPRRLRRSLATGVAALCLALPGCVAESPRREQPAASAQASQPSASDQGVQPLTVMTRNLYLGTGLTNLFRAGSVADLAAATAHDWSNLRATDFPTRAAALAEEIARARPDVVALQEVTLWREPAPGDRPGHASRVVLDLLGVLQHALAAAGTPYTAVATSTNADLEVPRQGLADLRITDRDVLLARGDEADRFSGPRTGHYTAVLRLPLPTGDIANTRGWVSVDYRADDGTTVRILATHLEVTSRGGGPIQERQAAEFLAVAAASPYPVIALGDFNAPAGSSATYARLSGALSDAWTRARPGDPGPTCCQSELLDNPVDLTDRRIDLVLSSQKWPVVIDRTGTRPFRAAPPPLWASDHVGVMARFTLL